MHAHRAYLDHNATSPLRPEARDAVLKALETGGNASSVHAEGRAARKTIEDARNELARLLNADPALVVFTSGGSEGAMTLLAPTTRRAGGPESSHLIVSATEHACVRGGGRFALPWISTCPVTADGLLDLAALDALLATQPHALVAVMLANNETGIVQPMRVVADRVHAAGGLLVVDAVQGLGKLEIDMESLGADAIFVSAHKIGGPQGVGAIIRASSAVQFEPLVVGGGQESRLRGGTENLAGIAGFGAAARAVRLDGRAEHDRIAALRSQLEAGILEIAPQASIIGALSPRLGNTLCVGLPGIKAETGVIAFDLAGVSIGAGAACSSGKVGRSHVLAAMGLPLEIADTCVRLSLGWSSTQDDVTRFLSVLERQSGIINRRKPEHAA